MKRKLLIFISLTIFAGAVGGYVVYALRSGMGNASSATTSPAHQVSSAPPVQSQTYEKPTVDELLRLVNEERARNGVAPLAIDPRLNQSAQLKSDDMAKYHYFAHISPNDGRHGYEYINDLNISCKAASENINLSRGKNTTARAIVDDWISSKPHHDAMIDSRYTTTGFGSTWDGGTLNATEHFCAQ